MTRRLRIGIVGYGTAGQSAAVLLSRDGHRVEVFEQAPVLGPVGAGFLLQPTGLSVLWRMGLLAEVLAHGAPIRRLFGESVAGRPVMDMRYRELDRRMYGLGMQRGALFSLLDAAWSEARTVHCGRRIVAVDAERGVLRDEAGVEHGSFDVVVVADGAASSLRTAVGEVALDRPYPWGAHWCLVPHGDWAHGDELRQRYAGARRMAGMLPVGTRPDDPTPRISFFWSVPCSGLTGPSDATAWRRDVASLWPEAAKCLDGTPVPEGLARARYRDAANRRWHRGRAVLLGDAAHAMSPQLGQGANMALMDAFVLREALRTEESTEQAFAAYEQERRRHAGIYHFWSRWLTPLFQSDRDRLAAFRDRVFHPLTQAPGGRRQVLRVLTGTRQGWLGVVRLEDDFLDALGQEPLPPSAGTLLRQGT